MPYVTVVFDPKKVSQETVDQLKPWLQPEVARVLSMVEVMYDDSPDFDPKRTPKDLRTSPDEIMVTQQATHPTDVNVPPLEIYIQAGRPKGRSGDKIVEVLGKLVSDSGILPDGYLGDGQSGIFVVFHEYNGFGFIPLRN
jgi:hypothetical protein